MGVIGRRERRFDAFALVDEWMVGGLDVELGLEGSCCRGNVALVL